MAANTACTDELTGEAPVGIDAETETAANVVPLRDGPVPMPLLRFSSDERLVVRARAGDRRAFESIYQRHGGPLLGYCRQMLGSYEEAEDAIQQTFFKAYRSLTGSAKHIVLRPWLYTIARHECISIMRRRETTDTFHADDGDGALGQDVAAQVQDREELRQMLRDIGRLPDEQREALVLTTLGTLSGSEVGDVIGCDSEQVKSLVFRARRTLLAGRDARDSSCEEVREQLSVLRGGSLRRKVLREHLAACDGCRAFRAEVRSQRKALAAGILPLGPLPALQLFVGGSAGVAGVASTSGAGGEIAAKLAVVVIGAIAVVGGADAVHDAKSPADPPRPPAAVVAGPSAPTELVAALPAVSLGDSNPASAGSEARRPGAAAELRARRAERRAARRERNRKRDGKRSGRGSGAGKGSAAARGRAQHLSAAAPAATSHPRPAGPPPGQAKKTAPPASSGHLAVPPARGQGSPAHSNAGGRSGGASARPNASTQTKAPGQAKMPPGQVKKEG